MPNLNCDLLATVERLKHCEPSVCLTSKNFQRLLLVSIVSCDYFPIIVTLETERIAKITGFEVEI
jgi:hypothetical protein